MDTIARLRRIRRYAVPRSMIERGAGRRLAGDWRGACAAAGMDVEVDLADVARLRDSEIAGRVEDALLHLVPDLVRWHAPRIEPHRTSLAPDHVLVLAEYGMDALYVTTPTWLINGPQRMVLRFGAPRRPRGEAHYCSDYTRTGFWRNLIHPWMDARHLWDDRHTAELRERCGGDAERAPFFHPDGTLRTAGELPASDPGPGDPAGHAEWVTLLHERGEVEAAFAAAGIELTPPGPESEKFREHYTIGPYEQLARMPLALARLEPEIRRLGGGRFQIPWTQHAAVLLDHDGERLRAEVLEYDAYYEMEELQEMPMLADASWRRLPDLDLLRYGRTSPESLHPLVRDALFPERVTSHEGPVGPPDPVLPSQVRVRCGGDWHEIVFRNGVLEIPHSTQERDRERALLALGGEMGGCHAAVHAWTSGSGRLPRVLRELRRDVFERARHGDTEGIVRLLDLGLDPRVRDEHGRTLLHVLHLVDHEPLLPRLLAAGVDIEAEDRFEDGAGLTALHKAVEHDGSVALIRALLDAGARIDLFDQGDETTLPRLIDRGNRHDLEWLRERVFEECPDLEGY
ncbi:ankyrin repeat domain-containing protein [Actinomadura sp. 9N407]|uniref:ankyrin repeat domain-containing protein n=1 Tax=Actinomadura sp. 9N407 TaxID=3375154 RepID=UPI0037BA3E00